MLQVDGDLWYNFASTLKAKGHHSFWATWVKGHVTMQAMRDDPDSIPDAIDNGVADLIAGTGATTAGATAQSHLAITRSSNAHTPDLFGPSLIACYALATRSAREEKQRPNSARVGNEDHSSSTHRPCRSILHLTWALGLISSSLLHLVESSILSVCSCSS